MQKVSQELHVPFESSVNQRLRRPCVELSVFVSHDVQNPEKVKENPYPKHVKTFTVVFNPNALSWKCNGDY